MDLVEFVKRTQDSEASCLSFLREYGLFPEESIPCPGKNGVACGANMKLRTRKDCGAPSWRCNSKKCKTRRSVRQGNHFFSYADKNGKSRCNLTLRKITTLLYTWAETQNTVEQMSRMAGVSRQTAIDWTNMFRETCAMVLDSQPKYTGTPENPAQADEGYFQGKRKANKGRLAGWDKKPRGENEAREEMRSEAEVDDENDPPNCTSGLRNHGSRVLGPWVVGVYLSPTQVRFQLVPDRSGRTLVPLLQRFVSEGSTIVTDEWGGYKRLSEVGFLHKTVNHQHNFVDPATGYHTQAIERAWVDAKVWLKRARGAGPLLQSHLDEVSWRKLRADHPDGFFAAFLRDVQLVYGSA